MVLLTWILLVSLAFQEACGFWGIDWVKQKAYNEAVSLLGFPTNDDCGYTRLDALACIKKHIDRNGDGEITSNEFEYAKKHFMPKRVRTLSKIVKKLGWDYTLENIKPNCDANKDGHFTVDDWMGSAKTCLPAKADLCKFQFVCKLADKKDGK